MSQSLSKVYVHITFSTKNAIRSLIRTLNKNYGHISAEFVKHWNVIPFVLADTTTIYIFVACYQRK